MQSDGPKGTRVAEKPQGLLLCAGESDRGREDPAHPSPGEQVEPVLTTRGRGLPAFPARASGGGVRASPILVGGGLCRAQTTTLATFPPVGGNFQQLLKEWDRKLEECDLGYNLTSHSKNQRNEIVTLFGFGVFGGFLGGEGKGDWKGRVFQFCNESQFLTV